MKATRCQGSRLRVVGHVDRRQDRQDGGTNAGTSHEQRVAPARRGLDRPAGERSRLERELPDSALDIAGREQRGLVHRRVASRREHHREPCGEDRHRKQPDAEVVHSDQKEGRPDYAYAPEEPSRQERIGLIGLWTRP